MSTEAPPADAPIVPASMATAQLHPADPADLTQTLAFALRYRARKRVDTAGEIMARITAERLVEHLDRPDERPEIRAMRAATPNGWLVLRR